ncbi:MAG: 2OG-Fe(II) oxygenase family protein [Actinomycetota bacterium]
MQSDDFAATRERELITEAESWDVSAIRPATRDDIPVVDVSAWRATGDPAELDRLGAQVREIGQQIGFHFLTGHGLSSEVMAGAFEAARSFLRQSDDVKMAIRTDTEQTLVPGAGYLPLGERKLPRRAKGNLNEAIIFKRDTGIALTDAAWPEFDDGLRFRRAVMDYAAQIERVALELVPVYARALDLPAGFFDAAMVDPFWRLRMTRYHPVGDVPADEFGIAPHVDTTFFTLLAQDGEGLTIRSERTGEWVAAPMVPAALVVNTGELLKQWSNDRFVSVKHFVPPHQGPGDRYSIPFFFNANADWPMEVLPTCTDDTNPPKYPTVSYRQSQAAAQGE